MGQLETRNNQTQDLITNPQKNGVDIHVWNALKNTLYSDAKDESIMMVLDYCKAAELDPMQKPVHIVPMYDNRSKSMKDTIMPGIGLYRIQAARSNQYGGIDAPEYGTTIEKIFTKVQKDFKSGQAKSSEDVTVCFPEWCQITVKKIIQGIVVTFTAKEYWIENYAKANTNSTAPNHMWMSRPFAQLAKCAEAQALRKAFPELVSHQPTAEEMEGKIFIEKELVTQTQTKDLSSKLDNVLLKQTQSHLSPVLKEDEELMTEEQEEAISIQPELTQLILTHSVSSDITDSWCKKAGVDSIYELKDKLTEDQVIACREYINRNCVEDV